MNITVRRATSDGRMHAEPPVALTAIRPDETAIRWVDLGGAEPADLQTALVALGLPEAAVARATDPSSRFDIDVQEHAVCFNLSAPAAWWQQADRAVVHVFVLDRMLVTAHVEPFLQLERALDATTRLDPRLPVTPLGLVVSLLRIFYLADGNFFHSLRREAYRLEDLLDSSVAEFRFGELIAAERAVTRVSETWLDNETAIRRLAGVAVKTLDVADRSRAIEMLAEVVRAFRQSLAQFDRRLEKDHRHYESLMQAVTERRLRFLTVISAVFLPLTLVAGIYGMNFAEMPELHAAYGYQAVLGFMVVLGVAALLYFYRKGWFR